MAAGILIINRGTLISFLGVLVLVVVLAAGVLVGNASAATYVVGDSLGWSVPPRGPTEYATWASQHVFRVGDVLVFNFGTGQHDVAQVTQGAYNGCSSTNPIALTTVGPANFTLNSTGPAFYICTFGQHCSLGQRLAINVTTAAAASPPSTTPAPTPTPVPVLPSPTTSPTPSPPTMPTTSPAPTPMPSAQAPGSSSSSSPTPAEAPSNGGAVTPPAPATEGSTSAPSSTPSSDLNPPPSPSSAMITTLHAPLAILASLFFALMI